MDIVNTSVPITSAANHAMILALVREYPFLRSEVIGATAFQRQLRTLVIGNGPRKVSSTAAHHANAWITSLLLLKYAQELARAYRDGGSIAGYDAKEIFDTATIYLLPMVDPDGVDLVTGAIAPGSVSYEAARRLAENYPAIPFPDGWKANLLGVDLNLNYPARWLTARDIKFSQGFTRPGPRDYVGRAPLNQLETRSLAEYTRLLDPALVLAYHSQGQEIYWQFDGIFVPGAEALGRAFAEASGYALADTPYASSFAGYKDWFIQEFRRPGYTVEVGLGENPLPLTQFDEIYRDNESILTLAALG